MNAAFRVDASNDIGVGHVSRCLTLAQGLRSRGVASRFICREHVGHLMPLLQDAGMSVAALPTLVLNGMADGGTYASWLGATQSEDASQTIAALRRTQPEWLVVDHYGLDAHWEHALRPHAHRLAVIDDLADRAHDCDLLLDQNQAVNDARYAGLVDPDCKVLLGPRYALLREEYAQYRRFGRRRDERIERVFVFFGGSDPDNLTGKALEALSGARMRHLMVDVVVGVNYQHHEQLRGQVASRPGTAIHGPRLHLADLMDQADLAIGAAGTTTWERMCIGLPSLVVSIAANQRPAAEALAQAGLIRYLGRAEDVGVAELTTALERVIDGLEDLFQQSLHCALTVDGLGARRVVECMYPTELQQLQLRQAEPSDAALFFGWVNEPEVRRQSLSSARVPWHVHREWFYARMEDSRSHLFVLESRGLPVGQIRFDEVDGDARIDYSIDAPFRGRGWGGRLVALGMQKMIGRGRVVFRAEVKESNKASAGTFAGLGYIVSASSDRADLKIFRFDTATQTMSERF